MNLAIFDLDNTLLAGDSDYLWGEYLCEQGYIEAASHKQKHQGFYDDYRAGRLDITRFLDFQLKPLVGVSLDILYARRNEYLEKKIRPIILEKACKLIEDHKQKGHELLIITATNDFLTRPIAELLGVGNLIATTAELVDGCYTGKHVGTPSYREGKVVRYNQWLEQQGYKPQQTWFYSDSHNDLPLLHIVDYPVAVDPDEKLKQTAVEKGWPVISLR